MPQYFFDFIQNGERSEDPEGVELRDQASARIEASRALAELAADTIPKGNQCEVGIEVRDEQNALVVRVGFVVEIDGGS